MEDLKPRCDAVGFELKSFRVVSLLLFGWFSV